MRIRRQLVIAVFLGGVHIQQLKACKDKQTAHHKVRYTVDNVPCMSVAQHIGQNLVHPVANQQIIQRPDAKANQAPADQSVVLGNQLFDLP